MSEWIAICRALEESPPNSASSCSRAWTDSEPVASQPAPESACSAFGAKNPSTATSSSQTISTARKWVAAQRPSLPIGPTITGCGRRGGGGGRGVCGGGHDDTPATAAESSSAWRSMLPQTASQIAITVSSAIE